MADEETEARGRRLRAVREEFTDASGRTLPQGEFAIELQRVAVELFGANAVEHKFGQSLVNRLEKGKQPPSLQDIDVYAAIDPKKRPREWFAWGERAVLDLTHAKPVSEAAQKRAEVITSRGAKSVKPKRGKASGHRGGSETV